MKRTLAAAVAVLACSLAAQAEIPEVPPSPLFSEVTNLWCTGQQSNVLAIANARLATNQNDIVALVLKASWDFDNAAPEVHSASHARMIQVGKDVKTPAFSKVYAISALGLQGLFKSLAEGPRGGSALKQKLAPMAYLAELYALDQDGWLK